MESLETSQGSSLDLVLEVGVSLQNSSNSVHFSANWVNGVRQLGLGVLLLLGNLVVALVLDKDVELSL